MKKNLRAIGRTTLKAVLLLIIPLLFIQHSHAQLSNRFYGSGYSLFAQDVGAYASNIFVKWRQVQKTPISPYNWNWPDSLVQANQSSGLRTMITLECTHPITSADTIPGNCAYDYTQNPGHIGNNWIPQGTDTILWKNFVDSIVDRYDGDGNPNDMPGLLFPVTAWHLGQEWEISWCSTYPDTSLANAQEFVKYMNMTYPVIKNQQPTSEVIMIGIDTKHQTEAFYDGYFIGQTTICQTDCFNPPVNLTASQLVSSNPNFLPKRKKVMYIFKNALYDEADVHAYGRWQFIPDVVKWVKDSTFNKPVNFTEGGGPFCKACETIYHNAGDNDGRLPALLLRDNASYVVYHFISALASDVKKIHWHIGPEYTIWGATWGDLDLKSINFVSKPSFYVYRWFAKTLFADTLADAVVRITESNPNLYHYEVQPMGMHVAWSTNAVDNIVVSGTGTLYTWDIPTTCDSLGFPSMYPTACDSVFPMNTYNVLGSHTIALNNNVPVFYSWSNVLPSTTQMNESSTSFVKVYPNPFSNSTTIQITNGKIQSCELKIYDLSGREVFPFVIRLPAGQAGNSDSFVIRKGDLPNGMYFYQLREKEKIIGNGKIIIQ